MTVESYGCLVTSLIMLASWWTLWAKLTEGSPMGQNQKPWESWDDFFGHSFRREPTDAGAGVSEQGGGCLPDCEQEGAFYPDGTSCNHFFVCTNNFEFRDKSSWNEFRAPSASWELHSLERKGNESLDQGSADVDQLFLLRCSCHGKRDVYNRYLQRCSRRGHCRVSCTAQGNVFGNWTSVTYNGYQCSLASLSSETFVGSSNTFHTTSKALGNEETTAFEDIKPYSRIGGNLPTEEYEVEAIQHELSEGTDYILDPQENMDKVTSVPLSPAVLNIQTSTSVPAIISAMAVPSVTGLPTVSSDITQFTVTQPSPIQETGIFTGVSDTAAVYQEITSLDNNQVPTIQNGTALMPDTLSVTITAVSTKPGTLTTPILLLTQTFTPDHIQITITPDISPVITHKPLTLPALIPVTEEIHRPVTLPATIHKPATLPETAQKPDIFPETTQKPVILPASMQKPVVLPETIQKPAILPGTTQMPTVLPASLLKPITLPEVIPKPAVFPEVIQMTKPLPLGSQIPTVLPATIQKPLVLPETVSNSNNLSGINQMPVVLPESNLSPTKVPSISLKPSLLPATIVTPAALPSAITDPDTLSGSISVQTSLTEISQTPTTLPDIQDPSKLPASNLKPAILPATVQKPATLPAISNTISTPLEINQTSDMTRPITQIPVLLPDTVDTLQTSHPLTVLQTSIQTIMTLPDTVQPSFTQSQATQKPVILPETIGTSTSSSRPSPPLVTLPGIIQTTVIFSSHTQGSISSWMTQMHDISSTPIQSTVILPTTSFMEESSSTMLPLAMQTSTLLPALELKPANCRPVKCRVANTRFPNPKDCTRYYKCVMHQGSLVAKPYICPSVMPTFSPSLMMCLRGIKCRATCHDEEVPELSSSSVMTTRIDNLQG